MTEAWVRLNLIEGLGPVGMRRCLEAFGSPERILGATAEELMQIGLKPRVAHAIVHGQKEEGVKRELEFIVRYGVEVLTIFDEAYPPSLTQIANPPPVLYVRGSIIPEDQAAIAMVGTRVPSASGLLTALRLGEEAATRGLTVVSGLARGIDSAAHRGALRGRGRTIAVLGCGLAALTPGMPRDLMEEIAAHGALVSEFPMGMPAAPGHFPQRNRIISGLALGVIVVEAPRKSGALITASCAAEQGRTVFAVPGDPQRATAEGCHQLIRDGAELITSMDEVVASLAVPLRQVVVQEKV